ncbi:triose-phosphate isomerase, partial [Sinorhizobium meliloti]
MSKSGLWVGTSWKMNKTLAEAMVFADGLAAADDARDQRIQRF